MVFKGLLLFRNRLGEGLLQGRTMTLQKFLFLFDEFPVFGPYGFNGLIADIAFKAGSILMALLSRAPVTLSILVISFSASFIDLVRGIPTTTFDSRGEDTYLFPTRYCNVRMFPSHEGIKKSNLILRLAIFFTFWGL